ncbi:MAG: class I tRNA ligase family protein [Patescibacteria group bacterium]
MEEKPKSETALREEATLQFWKENDIFKKSLEREAPAGDFVFYEGPPTANNHPAIHHLEARAFKDLIPRYKTMQGFRVRRKAGWDTHGLPVELEVEKELGLKNKKDIEAYGVEKFNAKCKESVLRYIGEWKDFTDRIGFWVDHSQTYFTFANEYIESVWHIVQKVHERGLLYKDYRVVPWCARCGTPLSSHEVADGYKDVTDTSVFVAFKLRDSDEHIAAWTTTPWTLPGNVALAVGDKISYSLTQIADKKIWVATERLSVLAGATVIAEKKGSELVGRVYEPLFPYLVDSLPKEQQDKLPNAYKIYAADFVTTEDGTGVVHTAVMYGAEDFDMGTKVGLPKHHLVNEEGKFIDAVIEFAGVFVKDANEKVIVALGDKVLKTEETTHAYPHCWRCKRPLIYYARDSWYIRMSALRAELMTENQKIHWEPAHIRDGRFGEWLKEVKDWAISRNRYWGTPLPIWLSKTGKMLVVGSLSELREKMANRSSNQYFMMRHGDAESNASGILSSDPAKKISLTEKGKNEVRAAATAYKGPKVDYIYVSPLTRTQETAKIVAEVLGVPSERVVTDKRLTEIALGSYEGKTLKEYNQAFPDTPSVFENKPDGGESVGDVRRRVGEFLYTIDASHKNETVFIVAHGDTTWMAAAVAEGASKERALQIVKNSYLKTAEIRTLDFTPLPHNAEYECDVHRPFIDEVKLVHEGEEYERIQEVMDVWFDSGAMPFAQDHYPFENKEWVDGKGYPADFISEAIDQTRGWFYTLHAIGVLMGRGMSYKNVISLGHLLDDKGKKMSKSLGNVIKPWDMIPKYGVDALRYWMFTVNEPGASKNFDEKVVDEILKKNNGRLLNVLSFYNLFREYPHTPSGESAQVLDRWILARLQELIVTVSGALDAYQVDRAARPLADFIDDLSTWFVRRSRDRVKGEDETDKASALGTLHYVLREFSKVTAPFMPFVAEHIYRELGGEKESVHLADWPASTPLSNDQQKLLAEMKKIRLLISVGLEARAAANIKVRQPLQSVTIKTAVPEQLLGLVKDELNVKEVVVDTQSADAARLDTVISDELRREGEVRDVLRTVQDLRKKKGLKPGEPARLRVPESMRESIEFARTELARVAQVGTISFGGENLMLE